MLFFTHMLRIELKNLLSTFGRFVIIIIIHLIYSEFSNIFQGDESSQDEKGASALLAKELDDQLGDRPMQVRVTQGKEPAHFRNLFQGSLIIHKGGRASSFKNRSDADSTDTDGVALFHVRGTQPTNTCGIQVREVAASLNSADCFVLVTPSNVYSWKGNGATADEHTVATNIGSILSGNYLGNY